MAAIMAITTKKGYGALLFHKAEVASGTGALEPGGQHSAAAVHGAQQEHKEVKFLRMGVQGGQLHIEVHQPHQRRHGDVDEGAGHGSCRWASGAYAPAEGAGSPPCPKSPGLKPPKLKVKGIGFAFLSKKLSKLIQIYHTGKV